VHGFIVNSLGVITLRVDILTQHLV